MAQRLESGKYHGEYKGQAPRVARCKSDACRAYIFWIRTAAGRDLPIDADGPNAHGSHWLTCKDVKRFARQKPKGDHVHDQ